MKATIEELKEWVAISDTSPSGLIWIKSPRNGEAVNIIAGGISRRKDSSYYIFGFNYNVYYVHRIVYCLHHNIPLNSRIKIDHIDGNQLNNSTGNLRIASNSQNSANRMKGVKLASSVYKGVYRDRRSGKWIARIKKSVNIYIGIFDLERDAAIAYNQKALELFGEYAKLNEIGDMGEWSKPAHC